MTKICPGCDIKFKDGDEVVAEVLTTYHEIPSKNTFAVSKDITQCLGLVHRCCYNDQIETIIEGLQQ